MKYLLLFLLMCSCAHKPPICVLEYVSEEELEESESDLDDDLLTCEDIGLNKRECREYTKY